MDFSMHYARSMYSQASVKTFRQMDHVIAMKTAVRFFVSLSNKIAFESVSVGFPRDDSSREKGLERHSAAWKKKGRTRSCVYVIAGSWTLVYLRKRAKQPPVIVVVYYPSSLSIIKAAASVHKISREKSRHPVEAAKKAATTRAATLRLSFKMRVIKALVYPSHSAASLFLRDVTSSTKLRAICEKFFQRWISIFNETLPPAKCKFVYSDEYLKDTRLI